MLRRNQSFSLPGVEPPRKSRYSYGPAAPKPAKAPGAVVPPFTGINDQDAVACGQCAAAAVSVAITLVVPRPCRRRYQPVGGRAVSGEDCVQRELLLAV